MSNGVAQRGSGVILSSRSRSAKAARRAAPGVSIGMRSSLPNYALWLANAETRTWLPKSAAPPPQPCFEPPAHHNQNVEWQLKRQNFHRQQRIPTNHEPQAIRKIAKFTAGQGFPQQPDAIDLKPALQPMRPVGMPSGQLVCDQHPGAEHTRHVARHILRQMAVANQIFWHNGEVICFRPVAIEEQDFAS